MAKREIEYKQRRPSGEEITRRISNINESAADSTVAAFVTDVTGLSQNTLTGITNVLYEDIPITNPGDIYAGPGKKLNVNNTVAGAVIYGDQDSVNACGDYILNSADSVSIYSGYGHDTISNSGNYVYIDSGNFNDMNNAVNDSISNTGDYVSIFSGRGNDTIDNSGDFVYIDGGVNTDIITNTGDNATILGNLSNNTISSSGNSNTFIFRQNSSTANSVDKVSITGGTNHTFQWIRGSIGFAHIYGFNPANDILHYLASNSPAKDSLIASVSGDDTHLTICSGGNSNSIAQATLYGVHGNSLRVQYAANEVTLYNLGE